MTDEQPSGHCSFKCGEEIQVRDVYQANYVRFVAQCHGRFMVICGNQNDYRNGYLLTGWPMVLRELVALTVPEKMIERRMSAQASPGGVYNNVPLTYPLSVGALAALLGADPDRVRAELEDMAVQVTG